MMVLSACLSGTAAAVNTYGYQDFGANPMHAYNAMQGYQMPPYVGYGHQGNYTYHNNMSRNMPPLPLQAPPPPPPPPPPGPEEDRFARLERQVEGLAALLSDRETRARGRRRRRRRTSTSSSSSPGSSKRSRRSSYSPPPPPPPPTTEQLPGRERPHLTPQGTDSVAPRGPGILNTHMLVSHTDVPDCVDVNTVPCTTDVNVLSNVSTVITDVNVLSMNSTVPSVTVPNMSNVAKVNTYSRSQIQARRLTLVNRWLGSGENAQGYTLADTAIVNMLMSNVYTDEVVRDDLSLHPGPVSGSDGTVTTVRESTSTAHQTAGTEPLESGNGDLGEERENLKAKAMIRRVLTDGLALTGSQAVPAYLENKRAKAETWYTGLDVRQSSDDKLGWPLHSRLASVRKCISQKLATHPVMAADAKHSLTKYDRVPESILPSAGPKYLWYHGEDGGWDDRRPSDIHPLKSQGAGELKKASVEVADLRAMQARFKAVSRYGNVLAHSVDMLREIVSAHVPKDHPQRQLASDVLEISGNAVSGICGAAAAGVIGHAVYERHMAFSRDDRHQVMSLDDLKKARAALGPVDSSEYLFGGDRTTLEKELKSTREDAVSKPILVDERGHLKKQSSFRGGPSTSSASGTGKKGGRSHGTKSGGAGKSKSASKSKSSKDKDYGGRSKGKGGKGGKKSQ